MNSDDKIIEIERFSNEDFRKKCGKIVFVKGVFDLTHAGHVRLFQKAKAYGDTLVVAIAEDRIVKKKKGLNRPILTARERGIILSEFASIDWIIYYTDLYQAMHIIQPAVFCASHFESLTVEEKTELEFGGVKFIEIKKPNECLSTTQIIKKILNIQE